LSCVHQLQVIHPSCILLRIFADLQMKSKIELFVN
jgi:hypothetical protein